MSNALTVADYEEVLEDHRRLVRELDEIWNGAVAARQASLVDLVAQIRRERHQPRPTTLYQQCARHQGLIMRLSCETFTPMRIICPHCEEIKHEDQRSAAAKEGSPQAPHRSPQAPGALGAADAA